MKIIRCHFCDDKIKERPLSFNYLKKEKKFVPLCCHCFNHDSDETRKYSLDEFERLFL